MLYVMYMIDLNRPAPPQIMSAITRFVNKYKIIPTCVVVHRIHQDIKIDYKMDIGETVLKNLIWIPLEEENDE